MLLMFMSDTKQSNNIKTEGDCMQTVNLKHLWMFYVHKNKRKLDML